MGSGASSQPHADAYDSLKLIAASEAPGSAPKPKAKEGPELKTVLDDVALRQHFKVYISTTYKELVRQQQAGVTDKLLDKTVSIALNFLQFYMEAADFEKFGDGTLRMMRAETITTKYLSQQSELKLPWGRVLVETTLWRLDEDKVPAADVFLWAKSDAYDYLDTEVFPHFLAEEGPSGYKAMAFSLGAARLRKGLTSHKSATKEEGTLLEQTLMEPARTAIFRDFLTQEEGSAGPDLLFLLLDLLDLKQMMTAVMSTPGDVEAKNDENSLRAAAARYVVGRMYKLYEKFLSVGSPLRELFTERELQSLTALLSATWEDLTPAKLDDIVQTTFTALCEYYVAFRQDPRSIKALKELDDAREERRHEIRAYAAQYESNIIAKEGLQPQPAPAPVVPVLGGPAPSRAASSKAITAAPPVQPPRTLEKETAELLIVLNNTDMERSFKAHLRKVRRENFLYFWREVEDFKSIPIAQTNYIQGRAEKIFDKYIKHGATSEIPVNVQTRIEVLGRLFRADIHIYDQASKDAIRCMLPEYVTWQVIRSQPTFASELRDIDFFDELQMKPSTEANKTLPISFKELLTTPAYNLCFKRFAEAEYCLAAVLFWNEVQDWKQLPPSSFRDSKFRKIYNKFLKSTANMPIQVSEKAMAEAESEFKGKFDTAESEVFVFLKTVLLPKFLESDYFNKLQAAITLEHVNGSLGDDALGAGPRSSPPPASTAGARTDVPMPVSRGALAATARSLTERSNSTTGPSAASEQKVAALIRQLSASTTKGEPLGQGAKPSTPSSSTLRGKPVDAKGPSPSTPSSSSSQSSSNGRRRSSSSSSGSPGDAPKPRRKQSKTAPSLVGPELTARLRMATTAAAGADGTMRGGRRGSRRSSNSLNSTLTDSSGSGRDSGRGKDGGVEEVKRRSSELATLDDASAGGGGSLLPAHLKALTDGMVAEPKTAGQRRGPRRDSSSDGTTDGEEDDAPSPHTGGELKHTASTDDTQKEGSDRHPSDPALADSTSSSSSLLLLKPGGDSPFGSTNSSRNNSLNSSTSKLQSVGASPLLTVKMLTGTSKPLTLKATLKDRPALKSFFYYCVANHCEELVLFHLEAEDFKHTPGTGFLNKQAKRIYATYLGPKARRPIALPPAVHDQIVSALHASPGLHLFDDAQAEAYGLLERNAFPGYLDSPQHEAYRQMTKDSSKFW